MPDALPATTLSIYPGLAQAPNMLACILSVLVNSSSDSRHKITTVREESCTMNFCYSLTTTFTLSLTEFLLWHYFRLGLDLRKPLGIIGAGFVEAGCLSSCSFSSVRSVKGSSHSCLRLSHFI